MYAIIKDFKTGRLSHEEVYENLKHAGAMKLMCYDTQYSFLEDGKIETVHVGNNDELVYNVITFDYPTVWTMFHDTCGKYAPQLPYGPWYYGYIDKI